MPWASAAAVEGKGAGCCTGGMRGGGERGQKEEDGQGAPAGGDSRLIGPGGSMGYAGELTAVLVL